MTSKYFRLLIPIVWFIGLGLPYTTKYENMIEANSPEYFISEACIWFISGVLFTFLLQYLLEYFKSLNIVYKLILMFILINIYTTVLWYLLWLPTEIFTNWNFGYNKRYHLLTFVTNGAIIFFWYFIYVNQKHNLFIKGKELEIIQLEASLKESKINMLKGQINPHFMFNSLNNIRGLMLEDVKRASNMLLYLSENLRYSLTKSNEQVIAIEDELEVVENYIELSKIQFEDRLKFTTNIDEKLLHKQIPPMMIQLLVENAVKHGISKQKNGGTVNLSIQEKNENIEIEVTNPGQLTDQAETTGIGLKNIKDRLYLLYKEQASFSIKEENKIVVATIKVPNQ